MPQLPEVETIRRQLEPQLAGRRIVDAAAWTRSGAATRPARGRAGAARRALSSSLGRRGKYLLLELEGERFLVMHLRMTGNLLWLARRCREPPRTCACGWCSTAAQRILFDDLRRFGTGAVLEGREALEEYLGSRLGPEPLEPEFTAEPLRAQASGRRAPVKAFLLDQSRIAGIGNIYATRRFQGPHTPAEAGRPAAPSRAGAAARRHRRHARRRHRRCRGLDRRLPARRRRARLDAGALPRPPARGRAVPALWHRGGEAARGRARDLHLPQLPARTARSRADGRPAGRPAHPPMEASPDAAGRVHRRPLERPGGRHRLHGRPAPREGAVAAADVRGGGPATPQTDPLHPLANAPVGARGPDHRWQRLRSRSCGRGDALAGGARARLSDARRRSCRWCRQPSCTTWRAATPNRRPGPDDGYAACEGASPEPDARQRRCRHGHLRRQAVRPPVVGQDRGRAGGPASATPRRRTHGGAGGGERFRRCDRRGRQRARRPSPRRKVRAHDRRDAQAADRAAELRPGGQWSATRRSSA